MDCNHFDFSLFVARWISIMMTFFCFGGVFGGVLMLQFAVKKGDKDERK